MRIIFGLLIVFVAFVLVPEIEAQSSGRDSKAIALVKGLPVYRLDKRLSGPTFSRWLRNVIGKSQKIEWEVNDCGEQDGSGRQKDYPICVEALTNTVDGIEIKVLITVGTNKRGIAGKPAVWGIWSQPQHCESKFMYELGDLAQELERQKRNGDVGRFLDG